MTVVIIPAYKPDQTLAMITDQLWAYGCQVVVVDDGSGEEYQSIFNRVRDVCIVLTHSVNRGKGAAVKTALRYIKNEVWNCDVVGIMDADGQHMTEDLMRLSEISRLHPDTLVLGVRSIGKKMPLRSRLGNRITRAVFKFVSGISLSDTQTGLRAFGPELIPELLEVKGDRYEYEMNVLMAFAKKGIPMMEVPIHTVYQDKNNSCSHFRAFCDSVRIYRDIFKFTLSSASGFVLDYMLFSMFMLFLPHTAVCILTANIAARVISAFYNYTLNCRFVFHTGKKAGTAVGYFILAAAILAMNSIFLEMFVHILHVPVYPAKLLTECLLFLLNWLIQNCVIFRNECRLRPVSKKVRL